MEDMLKKALEGLVIGQAQSYRNLSMVPLVSSRGEEDQPAYLLLDEALELGVLEVTEVTPDGRVSELKVVNSSPRMVLILDGEELVGAKQNRIVNTTLLIQAMGTLIIPVSCVEEGRWSYRTGKVSSQQRVLSPSLRAMKARDVEKSLRHSGEFRSDQGNLWSGIAERAHRHGAESPTMAMAEIYERERPSLGDFAARFAPVPSQTGALFLIQGRVAGMDVLGRAEAFGKIFRKLLESCALDALDRKGPEKATGRPEETAGAFLEGLPSARVESRPSVGLGSDLRFSTRGMTGAALALDGALVHLCAFSRMEGRPEEAGRTGRTACYSSRGRNRR